MEAPKTALDRIFLLIKRKVSVPASLIILIFGIFFLLGALSSLYKIGAGSWVPAAIYKTKTALGFNKISGVEGGLHISSTRYEFETIAKASRVGVYQLTTTDSSDVLAVERNTGLLVLLSPIQDGYSETILSESIFPENISGQVLLNKNKGMVNSKPPIIMDLHFGLGRLFYSIVVEEKRDSKTCQSLVLFEVPFTSKDVPLGTPIERFRTPCSLDLDNAVMWAGRIATDSWRIFLSVGEQRYDRSGYPKKDIFSAEDLVINKTVFGKILSFNPYTFTHSVYSTGHRNAQGLFWDTESYQLLSTEHGPNGGDEVNMINQGQNYGWPTVSYGKPYRERYPSGVVELNEGKNPSTGIDLLPEREGFFSGTHENFTKPILSWIPGVGVGNLVRIPSLSPLVDWRGDIIVATMGEGNLHRLKLSGKNVVMDENIKLGKRVRDMLVLSNGHLVLALDEGSLFILKVSDL